MEDHSQRTPALVAAGAAAVLILSMFLDWYKLNLPEQIRGREIDAPTYNAFEGLGRSDIALVVAAALAIIIAGVVVAGMLADSPAPGVGLLVVCGFALAVVIYRGTSSPSKLFFGGAVDTTLSFGWFLALAAGVVMVIGALLAYRAGPRLQLEAVEPEEDAEGAQPERRPGEATPARND